jgi:pSer/pThr/pTyr-binding forkhead associated (FHA) protein
MNVQLVVQNGNRGTRVLNLQSEETVIGRRQDCDLRIPSTDVSRRHCLLSMHDGCLNIEDLDSVNGTFVNGERISGRQLVMPGDKLQIGPVTFVAKYEMSKATRARLQQEGAGKAADPAQAANQDTVRAVPTVTGEDDIDVLPLAEEDVSREPTKHMARPKPQPSAVDDEEAIPLSAEFLDEAEWSAPANGDLRDLLSQLDDSKPRKSKDD